MNTTLPSWVFISLCFFTYFTVSYIYKHFRILKIDQAILLPHGLKKLNLKHIIGVVVFGLVNILIFPDMYFLINKLSIPDVKILTSLIVICLLCAFLSRKAFNNLNYQSFTGLHASGNDMIGYLVLRLVFLWAYEFFFRGVIFYGFLNMVNLWLAIVFTTILYMFIHLFDSKQEIFGAIPLGIVLCLFTYYTGSIWYAFIIHSTLSMTYEISFFKKEIIKTEQS